jgi:hypothetical protein
VRSAAERIGYERIGCNPFEVSSFRAFSFLVSTTTRFHFTLLAPIPLHTHFLCFLHVPPLWPTSSDPSRVFFSSNMSLTRTLAAAIPDSFIQPQLVRWLPGQTPLSTHTSVFSTILLYLVVIFAGQEMMKDRKPVRACSPAFPWPPPRNWL